jgi:parallel beta-helix repeat protein
MKMKIIQLITIILLISLININHINAEKSDINIIEEEIYKNKIIYVGGNGPGNHTKIQDAINISNDMDTIYVYSLSSPYFENIIIDKSITLIGEDKNTTIIDGENKGTTIIIKNNYIKIKEFTIRSNENIYFSSGIEIQSSDNIEITKNIIINNYDGMTINNSNNNNIYDNIIQNNGRTGISIQQSDRNIINKNNISNNNKFGIFYFYANYNTINNNKIIKNGDDGMVFRYSENNEIYSNNISGSYYYGVNLFSTENINNKFYYNNFYKNRFNARGENNNKWDNGVKGNYWDDYEEKYPNASKTIRGIWNTPYKLSGQNNFDRYPLIKPYNPNIKEIKSYFNTIIEKIILKILSII